MSFLKQFFIAGYGADSARELDAPDAGPARAVAGHPEAAHERARARAWEPRTRPLAYPGVLVLPPFDRT